MGAPDALRPELCEEPGKLVEAAVMLVTMEGTMKWHIILEVRFHGDPDGIEAILDAVMEHLVGAGVEGPAIGAALREGVAEVELVVKPGPSRRRTSGRGTSPRTCFSSPWTVNW